MFFKKKLSSPPTVSTAALVRDASSSSSCDRTSVGYTFKNRQPIASKPKEEREPIPVKQDLKPVKPDRPAKPVKPDTEVNIYNNIINIGFSQLVPTYLNPTLPSTVGNSSLGGYWASNTGRLPVVN